MTDIANVPTTPLATGLAALPASASVNLAELGLTANSTGAASGNASRLNTHFSNGFRNERRAPSLGGKRWWINNTVNLGARAGGGWAPAVGEAPWYQESAYNSGGLGGTVEGFVWNGALDREMFRMYYGFTWNDVVLWGKAMSTPPDDWDDFDPEARAKTGIYIPSNPGSPDIGTGKLKSNNFHAQFLQTVIECGESGAPTANNADQVTIPGRIFTPFCDRFIRTYNQQSLGHTFGTVEQGWCKVFAELIRGGEMDVRYLIAGAGSEYGFITGNSTSTGPIANECMITVGRLKVDGTAPLDYCALDMRNRTPAVAGGFASPVDLNIGFLDLRYGYTYTDLFKLNPGGCLTIGGGHHVQDQLVTVRNGVATPGSVALANIHLEKLRMAPGKSPRDIVRLSGGVSNNSVCHVSIGYGVKDYYGESFPPGRFSCTVNGSAAATIVDL